MNRFVIALSILLITFACFPVSAQKRGVRKPAASNSTKKAIVIDQRLAVLRLSPSLYAKPISRMSGGREIKVGETKDGDGVKFYRVFSSAKALGWIQSEAIAGNFATGDDERLARLIQGSDGFNKIERASIFIDLFPTSPLRPAIAMLFGDLIEEEALKLSERAKKNLDRREMAASGAPLHSFYLNFPFLDRYRRLGVVFLLNSKTLHYHYDGSEWAEVVRKFPNSFEAVEAQKRLNSLKEKLERLK